MSLLEELGPIFVAVASSVRQFTSELVVVQQIDAWAAVTRCGEKAELSAFVLFIESNKQKKIILRETRFKVMRTY